MIITGKLDNMVNCTCYEIEAVPDLQTSHSEEDPCGPDSKTREKPGNFPRTRVDGKGNFRFVIDDAEAKKLFSGRPPRYFFRVYIGDKLARSTRDQFVWTKRKRQLTIDLCAPEMPPMRGKVCGKITDCRGKGVAGLIVTVFDVDLYDKLQMGGMALNPASVPPHPLTSRNPDDRKEEQEPPRKPGTLLGTAVTNHCGEYCVCYTRKQYEIADIRTADIRVTVSKSAESRRFLQWSDIIFNAGATLTIDLSISGSRLDGSSEFTDYHLALNRLQCDTPTKRRNLTDDQLEFISREASIPMEHLVLWKKAYQADFKWFQAIGLSTSLPHLFPQVLYGLFRMGVSGNISTWIRRYQGATWEDIHVADKLGSILKGAVEQCIIERKLGLPVAVDLQQMALLIWVVSAYHALISKVRPQRSSWFELFAQTSFSTNPRFPEFLLMWLHFDHGDALYSAMEDRQFSPNTITQLREFFRLVEISEYYAPAVRLFLSSRANFVKAAGSDTLWTSYFDAPGLRPGANPLPPDYDDYSIEVRDRARMHYGEEAVATWALNPGAINFLPSLGLNLAQKTSAAKRISRLTNNAGFAELLASNGFTSARSIAALRWEDFSNLVGNGVQAMHVFTKAREVASVTTAVSLQLIPLLQAPFGQGRGSYFRQVSLSNTRLQGSTAESLFGSCSACDCDGRLDVFSPAAYLYYLRRFISAIPGATGSYDQRRPEAIHVEFTHPNCYRPLPVIDLNIELMEDLVARINNLLIDPSPKRRQTNLSPGELSLRSEWTNAAVYSYFSGLSLPWIFPFDLNHHTRNIIFKELSLERSDLANTTSRNPLFSTLAKASLGIHPDQYAKIESPIDVNTVYPISNTNSISDFDVVESMMRAAQLTFQELYAVTRCVHIFRNLPVPSLNRVDQSQQQVVGGVDGEGSNACSPGTYRLNESDSSASPIGEEQLDRLHRFVRLWRGLGWPMHLLNWAIEVFPVVAPEDVFPLRWLAGAELIRKRLGLEVHEVIAFWRPLLRRSWSMPFVDTERIPSPWRLIMKVNNNTVPPLSAIAANCNVSEQFAEQVGGLQPTVPTATSVFRYGRLAKALGVRPETIWQYDNLLMTGVFQSPESTWEVIENFEISRRSGAQMDEVLPLYSQEQNTSSSAEFRQLLLDIAEVNCRQLLPLHRFDANGLSFGEALGSFFPSGSVAEVETLLGKFPGSASVEAELCARIAETLALPSLTFSATATDFQRKSQIMTSVVRESWNKVMWQLLSQSYACSASTVKLISENVPEFPASSTYLKERIELLMGNGGTWTNGPSQASATEYSRFLREGIVKFTPAQGATISAEVNGFVILGRPGVYKIQARVLSVGNLASNASIVMINGSNPLTQGAITIRTLTVTDRDNTHFAVPVSGSSTPVTITTNVNCEIQFEIVHPSGEVTVVLGSSMYSDPAPILAARNALEILKLAGKLAKQWGLQESDISELISIGKVRSTFPQFPPRGSVTRPIAGSAGDRQGLVQWFEFAKLVASLKMTRGDGRKVLYETAMNAAGSPSGDTINGISVALDVDLLKVESAFLHWSTAAQDFANGTNWLKLFDLIQVQKDWGVTADTLESWWQDSVSVDAIASLEEAAKARLTQSGASDGYRKIADNIRVLKRNTLADYLVHSSLFPSNFLPQTLQQEVFSRKDLSDYLCSDVEMEPATDVTRIRFAIAGIQRFISQILSQKESFDLTADQENEWSSIYQYRLWEVRQKILLYPEIWMKFGRHLHMSPEFVEMDRSLLQGNLTEEMAEEALIQFVEGIHTVGHLEIVGTCPQQEYDATGALSLNLFHVIGRTPAEPRMYYHRTRVDGAYWTPWKKIELDIDGEQIVPFVHNRRVYLFWLVIDTKAQEKPEIRKDDRQLSLEDSYKTIRFAWSVLGTKGWKAKMLSKEILSTRFGHFAKNLTTDIVGAGIYGEIQAWSQASQNPDDYQIRPSLSDEGDPLVQIFAPLESVTATKKVSKVADWVENIAIIGDQIAEVVANEASDRLNTIMSSLRSSMYVSLSGASPELPSTSSSGLRRATTDDHFLIGTFRLSPDNLVEVKDRRTGPNRAGALDLSEHSTKIENIGGAKPKKGAFEFSNGRPELFCAEAYRTVLDRVSVSVRVVVSRQEQFPSQIDPVFCRIQDRSFFAFKLSDSLPPARDPDTKLITAPSTPAFASIPREQITRFAAGAGIRQQGVVSQLTSSFARSVSLVRSDSSSGWRFILAHHPQSIELLRAAHGGLSKLYSLETQQDPRTAMGSLSNSFDFRVDYGPVYPWVHVGQSDADLPKDELEFGPDQATAGHNWELLYHSSMVVASQLIKVKRFDEARKWIARVFNPRDSRGRVAPEKYWVFKPFHDLVSAAGLSDLGNLDPNGNPDVYQQSVLRSLIRQWRRNPFNPHAVAAFRPQAYQLATLFLYVENMIAWGDYLFAVPSSEMIEEAARRFEEADFVIGRPDLSTGPIRRQISVPTLETLQSGTFAGSDDLESELSIGSGASAHVEGDFIPDLGLGFFCLPPSPKFRELREKIRDRLFKVHHSLDLLGNPRKVPVYDPPIDPALLADAGMAGLNVSQIVMDAYTPRPHRRSSVLIAHSKGLAQQAISLGSGLLSAKEKRDAEALGLLRSSHELNILKRATAIRKLQVDDARTGVKVLEATMESVEFRRNFYESREFMNAEEVAQIALSLISTIFRSLSQVLGVTASAAGIAPDGLMGAAGMASPVALVKTGGEHASRPPEKLSMAMNFLGDYFGTLSSITGSIGSFRRRKEDWEFQAEAAKLEVKQVQGQIIGARIKQAIAEREWANHDRQVEESRDVYDFLKTKQTSVHLYEWLESEIGSTYYGAFQLAHNMALQAQRAVQDELGISQRFIGHAQWNSSHFGLHAGERLLQEISEMESFVLQQSRPETKKIEISLSTVDPVALATLRASGSCYFELTEEFWNVHAPRLYFKRFHTLAVSVPGVMGTFSGVHGRLSIEGAQYRKEPTLLSGSTPFKAVQGDPRIVVQYPRQGDSILLSTGNSDTGMSSDNSQEGFYRPGENLGVCAKFQCDIPQPDNSFNLGDIADVILHVEYTGLDGGEAFEAAARSHNATMKASEGVEFSIRHQFAPEWDKLVSGDFATLDLSAFLPSAELGRSTLDVKNLKVSLLVRVRDQYTANQSLSVSMVSPLSSTATNVAVNFILPTTGGKRYGMGTASIPTVVQNQGAQTAAKYEDLAKLWKVKLPQTSLVVEDMVFSLSWKLGS